MQFSSFKDRVAYVNEHPHLLPKVLVLYGGQTNEEDVSIDSGESVALGLEIAGVNVIPYEVTSWARLIADLPILANFQKCEVVFSLIHGGKGEDGSLHAVLDMLGIPYVGSNQTASALAMNKFYCKKIWADLGLNIPHSYLVQSLDEVADLEIDEFPVIVKPANEGSSNGITKVQDESTLTAAVVEALKYSKQVLIEQFIAGNEVTVAIVDNEPLMPIEIVPASGIYDYHAKYIADDTQFFCPPKNINQEQIALLQKASEISL